MYHVKCIIFNLFSGNSKLVAYILDIAFNLCLIMEFKLPKENSEDKINILENDNKKENKVKPGKARVNDWRKLVT